jgi:hypothetical protein
MTVENLKIESERIIIVPFNTKYLNEYVNEFTEDIVKYQYPESFQDMESAKNTMDYFLDMMEQGKMLELTILTKQEEFLGSVEAFHIDMCTPEVGLWLKASAHGKGYGYEALYRLIEYLNGVGHYISYVYEVDERNVNSMKLVTKFKYLEVGFEKVKKESGKVLHLKKFLINL